MKPKVLIAAPVHPVLINTLIVLGYELVVRENINQSLAFDLIRDCEGVITSTRLQLDRKLIDAAPGLRWIGRMGSGMEVIDLEYAAHKKITCFGSPEGNCNAVAEHAIGMLLSLIRNIGHSQNEMQNGLWRREENRGTELEGKTIGIIGYGHTGAAFARKLSGFDVKVIAYDKYAPEKISLPVQNCTLNQIFELSDVISFHVPLQADTNHYFNQAFLEKMKRPFILINTCRGPVVDTNAVVYGLTSKKIIGVCLDVYEHEPITNSEFGTSVQTGDFLKQANVVCTPHIAGYTQEALYKMSKVLAEKLSKLMNMD